MTTTRLPLAPFAATSMLALATLTTLTTTQAVKAKEATQSQPTIVVSATGQTQTAPDMAVIHLAVVTNGKTAQDALIENNESMNNVLEAFKKSGIEEADLQTSGLSIYPVAVDTTTPSEAEQTYRVSNSLTVRIRDLDNAGKMFDQAMNLGINAVNGISFTNADQKPFYVVARKNAVAEAMEKAKTLAEAAHVKLGSVLSIHEENYSTGVTPRLMSASAKSDSANTNFTNGELDYSVNVTVKFAIEN
ncbi:SIMPL domain-containing protein [Bartonella tamiae]|uniref:26 kDa periplasmic immunogenic protein n=1 Tax=Bartonella tamiae Th239 TaxID=1094558 RepID=J0R0U4_9HYPH|nr:SIMPL domain-containing protein [Bartonella tamiae]EJF89149.1 hypothetical protein ME5_01700 [Bartonella tamiae Th239]EJF95448.1 hypothetical protein MEG_00181 [Bartonella tamiae Th307]